MIKEYKILDHGYVRVIDWMGSDELIVESARMSTDGSFRGWDKDEKFLEFLYKNSHMSPFEMCELIVEVQAPLFVFREWHRHRTGSYNELSGRYTQMPDVHFVPCRKQVRKQSKKNKQVGDGQIDDIFADKFIKSLKNEQETVYNNYNKAIKYGVAKEIARINTPLSRYSRMRAKSNLRNWLHFIELRSHKGAQSEIREYSFAIENIINDLWPRSYKMFCEHTKYSTSFSRTESGGLTVVLQKFLSGESLTDFERELCKELLQKTTIDNYA